MTQPAIHPVVLSGGVGSRLWPLSRALTPKQLLPLTSDRSMLLETVARVRGPGFAAPIVVCSDAHRFQVAEQMREADMTAAGLLLEPCGRNTAPAIAVAALKALELDSRALILVMPSDHVVADMAAFHQAIACATGVAGEGWLVTFGIAATHPETGYGYIHEGEALAGHEGVSRVARFVEKPDAETAADYLARGGYHWNAGIFLMAAEAVVAALERYAPDVMRQARAAFQGATRDLDFDRLEETAFARCPNVSIDVAVMERSDRVAVVPVDMGWNDVGSWNALWQVSGKDADANVLIGDVQTHDVGGSYVRSDEGRLTAVIGLNNVVVVTTDDSVLVVDRARAQDVKKVVDALKANGRGEHASHSVVHRPWGNYRTIDLGDRFQVKQIVVKPKAKLSLQYHHHRAEHWIVVEGTARVTCGGQTFLLRENESTFIPIGDQHRLENPGVVPLRLIEVQSGSYLGEDDIERVDDAYGRIGQNGQNGGG